MKIKTKICVFASTMLALSVQSLPALSSQAGKQVEPVKPVEEVIAPKFEISTVSDQAVFVEFEKRGLRRAGTLIGRSLIVAPYHATRKIDGSEQVTIFHENGVVYGRVFGGNEDFDLAYISAPSLSVGSRVKMAQTMPVIGEPLNFVFRTAGGVTSIPGTYGGQNQNLGKINLGRRISTTQYGGVVYDACGYFLGTVSATEKPWVARKQQQIIGEITFVSSQRLRITDGFSVTLAPSICPTRKAVLAQERRIAAAIQKASDDKVLAAEDKKKADAAAIKAKEDAKRAADAKAQAAKNAKLKRSAASATKRAKEAEDKAKQAADETEMERLAREEAEKKAAEAETKTKEKEEALNQTEKEKQAALELAEQKKKQNYIIGGAAGGALLLLALISWLLIRKQRKARTTAELDASHQRDYAENLKSHIPPNPYSDCLLYADESLKLPGSQLPEAAGGVIIGRHPAQAQVVLDRTDVSRNHARFYVRNNEVYLEDLGSTNGSFVNTRRLNEGEKSVIQTGDYIKFGKHEFEFRTLNS